MKPAGLPLWRRLHLAQKVEVGIAATAIVGLCTVALYHQISDARPSATVHAPAGENAPVTAVPTPTPVPTTLSPDPQQAMRTIMLWLQGANTDQLTQRVASRGLIFANWRATSFPTEEGVRGDLLDAILKDWLVGAHPKLVAYRLQPDRIDMAVNGLDSITQAIRYDFEGSLGAPNLVHFVWFKVNDQWQLSIAGPDKYGQLAQWIATDRDWVTEVTGDPVEVAVEGNWAGVPDAAKPYKASITSDQFTFVYTVDEKCEAKWEGQRLACTLLRDRTGPGVVTIAHGRITKVLDARIGADQTIAPGYYSVKVPRSWERVQTPSLSGGETATIDLIRDPDWPDGPFIRILTWNDPVASDAHLKARYQFSQNTAQPYGNGWMAEGLDQNAKRVIIVGYAQAGQVEQVFEVGAAPERFDQIKTRLQLLLNTYRPFR